MKSTERIADVNLALAAGLAEKYLDNPDSVSETWRVFFDALSRDELTEIAGDEAVAVWEARKAVKANGHAPGANGVDASAAMAMAYQLKMDWAVRELVRAYRQDGHLHAAINPLRRADGQMPHIDYRAFGLQGGDLDRQGYTGNLPLPERARIRDIIEALEATWCHTIGYEVMHVDTNEERQWWLERIESSGGRAQLDGNTRRWIFHKLTEAALLEQFLGRKFIGAKRFSVEGCESIIPMLHVMIESFGAIGAQEIVLGMAHRGRLSVLINIMGQTLQDLFVSFKDTDAVTHLGGGDVKYHMGRSRDVVTKSGQQVHLSLCFNPSHLEFVNPVCEGRVRAKQDRIGDKNGNKVVPLLIHGDAAVIGQGVVHETLNLSKLRGYQTGGTVHIVLNNQIGFTTDTVDARSTRYCTDLAKVIGAPVMHVNAEDLNAVVFASQAAVEYRQRFNRDVFIDLVSYRRHGHNEGDEPRFTQPLMYQVIDNKRSIREAYRDELIARGDLTEEKDQDILDDVNAKMEAALERVSDQMSHPLPSMGAGVWAPYVGGPDSDVERTPTGVDKERLVQLLGDLSTPPDDFEPHRKLNRLLKARKAIASGENQVDWAAAEHLAFATLLADGHPVRITGQDVRRGTFAHRHAVLANPDSGQTWTPLNGVATEGDLFRIYNSPLSEAGVLGFEFGYSLDCPDGLTIWEAQFGDFANGAQVIIDQFISSTEDKWNRLSGLTLLLPHGFEGQGPEHSSARLERFLQQCAEDNMQVCNLTTPAQVFHALRRQVVRPIRKPLIVMSPKSLLRHKRARNTLDDLATGRFQRIIPNELDVPYDNVKRVLLCTGRLYYDLIEERERRDANDVAILRFEQLFPLSRDDINDALEPYQHSSFYWVQDEPWNMGAWGFIQAKIRDARGRAFPVNCISRAQSASPATGSHASHKFEAEHLMELAFGNVVGKEGKGAVEELEV